MTYALQQKLIPERMPIEQAFFDPRLVTPEAKYMSSIIDIHPHVISTDNVRYPLQPLGGNQSTWSRERPTPYEKLIRKWIEAGVDKAAIVQASTAYGHDNSYVAEAIAAYPGRFTGVFSVDVLAPDAVEKMRHWLQPRLYRNASVHNRQHHAGPGHLVRRSAQLSGMDSLPAKRAFRSACR